jgi:hypothetical protein
MHPRGRRRTGVPCAAVRQCPVRGESAPHGPYRRGARDLRVDGRPVRPRRPDDEVPVAALPSHVPVQRAEFLLFVPDETRHERRRVGGERSVRAVADVLQPRRDVGADADFHSRVQRCQGALGGTVGTDQEHSGVRRAVIDPPLVAPGHHRAPPVAGTSTWSRIEHRLSFRNSEQAAACGGPHRGACGAGCKPVLPVGEGGVAAPVRSVITAACDDAATACP